jgi:hypothetical protein
VVFELLIGTTTGYSGKQWRDIVSVLRISGETLDNAHLNAWAARLKLETLLARARAARSLLLTESLASTFSVSRGGDLSRSARGDQGGPLSCCAGELALFLRNSPRRRTERIA